MGGPRKCYLCGHVSNKEENVALHSFPNKVTDQDLYNQWLTACKLSEKDIISTNHRICTLHFHKNDRLSDFPFPRLKSRSIPSINIPNPRDRVKPKRRSYINQQLSIPNDSMQEDDQANDDHQTEILEDNLYSVILKQEEQNPEYEIQQQTAGTTDDEKLTSPPAKTSRKSVHKIRSDFEPPTIIDIDKNDATPSSSKKITAKRLIKRSNNIRTTPTINPLVKEDSSQEINNSECETVDNLDSLETKLHLAEFRIIQYQKAVQHLQNRLETSITELSQLKEQQVKDAAYYNEEIDSRNRKIVQLENENATLMESLSKKIVKLEDSVQNDKEERILGY